MGGGLSLYSLAGVLVFAGTLAIRGVTVNRVVRSRLRLTLLLFAGFLASQAVLAWAPVPDATRLNVAAIARLLLAVGCIQLLVLVAVNPLRVDQVSNRFPTIVQDAIVIALFAVVATFVFDEKFLTTSAVGAVVVGFALQDTLGNMFSGLAIQVEKPFRVGHWIAASGWEGAVTEITWRATQIRTRQGNLVVVPNSELSKAAITNYSEPTTPTRVAVEVGASYNASPTHVKATILGVMRNEPMVLSMPEPFVQLVDFGSSSMQYRANFWILEAPQDDVVRDRVRCGIYYAFQREQIEIPFPIHVQYNRREKTELAAERLGRLDALLAGASFFAQLGPAERQVLARNAREHVYGAGETIVRQGEPGSSAFVVASGRVRVTVQPGDREVATIDAGGLFGEMSLLTGATRAATVSASGDCRLLEVTADSFREVVLPNPAFLDRVTAEVVRRRTELEAARDAAAAAPVADSETSLLSRIRRFLLGDSAVT